MDWWIDGWMDLLVDWSINQQIDQPNSHQPINKLPLSGSYQM